MWLYVPGISSPSAPESEDLNSVSCSLSAIGERLAKGSATWRGKPQQPQAWSRRWRQGGFIRLLSGLTCSPSTLDHGVASFISSLRAIHARTIASPESGLAPKESAFSPPKSAVSPKSAGLILSSAKTFRGTRTDSLQPSLRHWKGWATALRQEYSARPPLATPCGASDCSSWPYARARDSQPEGLSAGLARMEKYSTCSLSTAAQEWMAPQVPNGGRSTAHAEQVGATLYHNGKKVQMGLESQVRNWSSPKASDPEKAGPNMRGSKGDVPLPGQAANWAGPAAQNHKGSSEGSIMRADGKSRDDLLHYQAEQFFRPPLSLAQPIAGGSMSSTDSPNSNQPSVKRKLNPIFVEALMRWPTGLSGFERQEMVWTRWWQLQLSFLSDLCSVSEADCAQADLFAGVGA